MADKSMQEHKLAQGRAWVLGGSVAGLLAARALSDHYEHVFVVERDEHVGDAVPRKGAPQGRHVHAFLPRGVATLEKMLPGIFDEIIAAGATNGDLTGDAQWCPGGHRLKRSECGLRVIAATRPFFESFVARRVGEISNVQIIKGKVGTGFRAEDGKITGIKLRDRNGEEWTEDADVLVDATGRASQLPKWLGESGYNMPPEERVEVKLRYATARFRRSTAQTGGLKAVIIGASKTIPRGGFAQSVENDILQASMAEYANAPPSDLDDFIEYAKTLPQPDLYNWIRNAEAIDEVKTHLVPAAYRRHYDRTRGLPDGLLAIGDAICAFNPVYAQGMTVATIEADLLLQCLAAGKKKLSKRFFKAIRSVTGVAWQIGSTNDLSLPIVVGRRTLQTRIIGSWISRVQKAGTKDAYIAERFIRVASLLDPPSSLLSPAFAWRVLRGGYENPGSTRATAPDAERSSPAVVPEHVRR